MRFQHGELRRIVKWIGSRKNLNLLTKRILGAKFFSGVSDEVRDASSEISKKSERGGGRVCLKL